MASLKSEAVCPIHAEPTHHPNSVQVGNGCDRVCRVLASLGTSEPWTTSRFCCQQIRETAQLRPPATPEGVVRELVNVKRWAAGRRRCGDRRRGGVGQTVTNHTAFVERKRAVTEANQPARKSSESGLFLWRLVPIMNFSAGVHVCFFPGKRFHGDATTRYSALTISTGLLGRRARAGTPAQPFVGTLRRSLD